MNVGQIISYNDMTNQESFTLQKGMNFNVKNKDYHIILMSTQKNAPYKDTILPKNKTIIYEGHNIQKNHNKSGIPSNKVDQPMYTPSGTLTENGKFYNAVKTYKQYNKSPDKVKVYEKIKSGMWRYNGYFYLTDAWIENDNYRNVFKFKLDLIDEYL
ncbi:MAG: hypothetical protein J6C50_04350 [Rickettsiales bacterium]|nr:hypothetical protein [Rickettsiales bacterium]